MPSSATDVMHDVIFAAVIDAIGALKSGAGNLPNTLLRDMGAIHANTTFEDLPEGVRKAIEANVRSAFTRLLKEGYSVSTGTAPPARTGAAAVPGRDRPTRSPQGRPPPRHPTGERKGRDPGGRPPRQPRGDKPGGGKPGGGKPGGGGRPGGSGPGGSKPGSGSPKPR